MYFVARHLYLLLRLEDGVHGLPHDALLTSHRVSFAAPSLAICEYADIEAINKRLDEFLNLVEDLLTAIIVSEYSIKLELFTT